MRFFLISDNSDAMNGLRLAGIEGTVARSEAEVESYLQEIDCLMVGPHLKYLIPELEEKVEAMNIKVILMEKSYYSLLDGAQALDHLLAELNKN